LEDREDAERVRAVREKRLAQYGWTLHPTKTHRVDFRVERDCDDASGGPGKSTFDFLGFTQLWKRSRRGAWVVRRRTAPRRLARALRHGQQYGRRQRHDLLRQQPPYLCQLLRGHYAS